MFNANRNIALRFLSGLCVLVYGCNFDFPDEPIPEEPTPAPGNYVAIASGNGHSLALGKEWYSLDYTLWAWGENTHGQLGDSTTMDKNIPVRIGYKYTAISAGSTHSLALISDSLMAWGDNRSGQLGDGTYTDKIIPTLIDTGYAKISAGGYHSLGLKKDGTLWAWGGNGHGQVGDGTNEDRNLPVPIGSGYLDLEAGGSHSIALKTDGTLWAWGSNEYGQIGENTNPDQFLPVKIGSGYSQIAAGGSHSLAMKADGSAWAWGKNEFGQLGDGTQENRRTPIQVKPGSTSISFDAIAAGENHSLFREDGRFWVCGKNDFGQLGDGTNINRDRPVPVVPGFLVFDIVAGGDQSFAMTVVYEEFWLWGYYPVTHLWGWGDNQFGQLGCGAIPSSRNRPLHIGPN